MSRTCLTRRRKRNSNRRSAQAGTGRCGCGRAGQGSKHILAERARTRSRSPSGFVPAAAGLLLSTDPHSLRAAGCPSPQHQHREVELRTRERHHCPHSGQDFPAEWPREESNLRAPDSKSKEELFCSSDRQHSRPRRAHTEVSPAASALAELRHGRRNVGVEALKRLLHHG